MLSLGTIIPDQWALQREFNERGLGDHFTDYGLLEEILNDLADGWAGIKLSTDNHFLYWVCPVSICCEYNEYEDLPELKADYSGHYGEQWEGLDDEAVLEWFRDRTSVYEGDLTGKIIINKNFE